MCVHLFPAHKLARSLNQRGRVDSGLMENIKDRLDQMECLMMQLTCAKYAERLVENRLKQLQERSEEERALKAGKNKEKQALEGTFHAESAKNKACRSGVKCFGSSSTDKGKLQEVAWKASPSQVRPIAKRRNGRSNHESRDWHARNTGGVLFKTFKRNESECMGSVSFSHCVVCGVVMCFVALLFMCWCL